jgi:7-cyano-7-deazaguanine synthase
MKVKSVALSLSGGLDSAVLLHLLSSQGIYENIHCVHFRYNTKSNVFEFEAFKKLVENIKQVSASKINSVVIDLSNIFSQFPSDSTSLFINSSEQIPEKTAHSYENIKNTMIPGRNTIFISVLLGYAESLGINTIALGAHEGKKDIVHIDQRKIYIKRFKKLISTVSDGNIKLICPLLNMEKSEIIALGWELGVPFQFTRTCYQETPLSCGKCSTCLTRKNTFIKLGLIDPLQYMPEE